jgi:hypothetical protein
MENLQLPQQKHEHEVVHPPLFHEILVGQEPDSQFIDTNNPKYKG